MEASRSTWAGRDREAEGDGYRRYRVLSDGRQQKSVAVPKWSLSATYYWPQKFPAGREVVIQHRYKPSVGAAVVALDSMIKAKSGADIFFDDVKARSGNSPREIFIDCDSCPSKCLSNTLPDAVRRCRGRTAYKIQIAPSISSCLMRAFA
ncbi:DUF4424 family protein [Afipia felis]